MVILAMRLFLLGLCGVGLSFNAEAQTRPHFLEMRIEASDVRISGEAGWDRQETNWSWTVGKKQMEESPGIQWDRRPGDYYRVCVTGESPEGICRYCRAIRDDGSAIQPDQGLRVSIDREKKGLYFQLDREYYLAYIRIFNAEGKEIYSGNMHGPFQEMDISRLKPGTYTFRISQPGLEDDVFEMRF